MFTARFIITSKLMPVHCMAMSFKERYKSCSYLNDYYKQNFMLAEIHTDSYKLPTQNQFQNQVHKSYTTEPL